MRASLFHLLKTIRATAGERFSGIGLVVSDTPWCLPMVPLRLDPPRFEGEDPAVFLASLSVWENDYHDGFHVLSTSFIPERLAQYFSPPPDPAAVIDRSRRFGGRYLAAQFGSSLAGVALTGIASRGFGVAVFERGAEVCFEGVEA